jgi:hypothetical protein
MLILIVFIRSNRISLQTTYWHIIIKASTSATALPILGIIYILMHHFVYKLGVYKRAEFRLQFLHTVIKEMMNVYMCEVDVQIVYQNSEEATLLRG